MSEVNNEEAAVAEVGADNASPKRSRKKLPVVIGVVVAVLVVAGAGFMVWHEQPSFCNAICHTPMDPYLPTYEAEPGQACLDKWGNEVTDASGMMASLHRAEAGTTCMGCHVPTLGEQISEGLSWITGDYGVLENSTYGLVLPEKTLADLVEARGIDEQEFCLNEACHNMTRAELTQATASLSFNPHVAQHGENTCSDCHKAHRASVYQCASCHNEVEMPDGWVAKDSSKPSA